MKIKLSDYVVKFLVDQGVKHVFMVPGGGAMHLNDSIGHNKNIEFVCNQHEQASAMAAETYARIAKNNMGVALVTTGPGGTNAITGVAGAWLDSTPCMFISGQVKRSDLIGNLGVRQNGVQEVNIVPIVKSITKYSVTIMDPSSIRFHLEKAVYLTKSGRPGPVWIDIPLDVQASIIDIDQLEGFDEKNIINQSQGNNISDLVSKTIELLNKSERPILLLGNGTRLSGAIKDALFLIEQLKIPVLLTWPALDILSDSYDLLVGRPGPVAPRGANFALQNSDCLISIGARLDTVVTGYSHEKFARAAKKIMIDIDPAEINKMQTKIDVPICSDVKIFIQEMIKQLNSILPKNRSNWLIRCKEWKKKYPVVLLEYREEKLVSTYVFTEVLSDELNSDDIVIPCSSGAGIEIFLLAFKAKKGQRVLNTTALGSMGNGLPASIGGCLASDKKRTICVDGDGGIQFNIQEFETLARLNLPIKIFVLNNQGYSSIRTSQMRYFNRLTGADSTSGLELPDICKVAQAYGLKIKKITSQEKLADKLREVLNMAGTVVCEILTPPDEPRAPSMSTIQKQDGTMVSKPLEDLWPFLDRKEFLENMIIPPLEE
ncbi:thiamine pyrophosphate-binding protein [candidate division WOR-1 bacterium RIFOXYC2_FULL_37_10]|uniref:Thiamine pyrophosphate-binding protein n=1 Tax=candidate division WOR-1 bacterium RIFOXYB2_FULL_37_13 TaxID=1802579 RepID=A0A1F4SQ62_UNCSA|nr:MAG: thiamine pyrophosphate-binding protein [candidate division WOR-1 bacterium RIFOXYA2_FULL_37_7]OGC22565.1 MAG: thiamine pyrophosphate-binding protein [candidate division WOR-1 bacterium RIFOXYB2_FULL_37_13]OGC33370.1 MAG: thiamine pyrophosphate-binding protein [candidate division WOR-1 bacterium RIFOXYC2_FULL_37_10]